MEEKIEVKLMPWFTISYLLFFTVMALLDGNYEFLYYTVIMSALILIIVLYHKKLHLSNQILLGLTIVGAMHIFGGNVHIQGVRLYDFWLIPEVFKYDNLVHMGSIFVATFVSYNFLAPHLDTNFKHSGVLLSLILVSISMGIGSFNEVLELGAVVFLGAAEQVGNYMNNAIDLVYNLIGSIIACYFIIRYHKK